ncbi:hypothetical protein Acr_11g0004780 [Actinidia rufa]|uniref:Phorbol-ester/DAG-type domain-containing protein n=1 Tax=Actinidia rufa TaxID=165716 RepID=A0A7J0FBU7_9ERIC|nr:hypothetical protein Acr_11g0004780 [Actinidia rufa]
MARHFEHTNPLIIHNELPNLYGKEVCCIACRYPLLSGPFYSCGEPNCYVHKVCAEVPLELKHPLHSDHTLILVTGRPNFFKKCKTCYTKSRRERMYECLPCGFRLGLECASMALRIQHECHPHPLIPLLKPALFFCYACSNEHRGVSYQCSSCYFLVHESCASMPSTLKNSHHNHPLTLSQCEGFYLDVKCATLSALIKHEGHKHLLTPTEITNKPDCSVCSNMIYSYIAFKCDICDFIMHSDCAMLPPSLKHRYDKHPFVLTYYPLQDHPAEYYCEICEDEVNPKKWFYHCVECDQSIHLRCVQCYQEYSNIKFGASFKVKGHQHPLNFVQFSNEYGSRCNVVCGKRLHEYFSFSAGFECGSCEFKLHLEYARYAAKEE